MDKIIVNKDKDGKGVTADIFLNMLKNLSYPVGRGNMNLIFGKIQKLRFALKVAIFFFLGGGGGGGEERERERERDKEREREIERYRER